MAPIRLIVDPPASGAWNMSVDEALLHSVAEGTSPDTLRFYQWSEPTLSLGYFQSIEERVGHLASRGCPVVRRSSGGGAIIHDRELTYSLAMRVSGRFAARELYDAMHGSLLAVLEKWSVRAELFSLAPTPAKEAPFLCFQRRAIGDVIFRGVKICGSAQRRVGNAVLQHGSLLLSRSTCAPELAGIRELGGVELPGAEEFCRAWKAELEICLGWPPLTESPWTSEEIEHAQRWEGDRFANAGWNSRR